MPDQNTELFIVTHYSCTVTSEDHYYCTCSTEAEAEAQAIDLLHHKAKLIPELTHVHRVPGGRMLALRKVGSAVYLHVAKINRETIIFG